MSKACWHEISGELHERDYKSNSSIPLDNGDKVVAIDRHKGNSSFMLVFTEMGHLYELDLWNLESVKIKKVF